MAILNRNPPANTKNTTNPGDVIYLQNRVTPGFKPRGNPPPFKVNVPYEDDHLAVVIKPPGVCSHPPPGGVGRNVMSMRTAIQYTLKPPPENTMGALYRPHLVHRLDRPTTGLLLCAKTKPSLLALQRAFALGQVHKRYCAIVSGWVSPDAGQIDSPVHGKQASTQWQVTARARSLKLGGGHLTMLSLYPKTGRHHQLRVHCSQILKCPIVGDKAYGGEQVGSGLLLAAVELSFTHPSWPSDAQPLTVEYPLPTKFGNLMHREHLRWERLASSF